MCGLVGMVAGAPSGFSYKEVEMFNTLLWLDQLRGFDSTGTVVVDSDNNVDVWKEASDATRFLRSKEAKEFSDVMYKRGRIVFGHNRAATRGSISDKNAHPFVVDNRIILAQNGTYKGSHTHLKNTEVDTEAIAHVIAEETDVATALKRINAAYALMWYDVSTRTYNIIRNNERPMFVAYTTEDTAIFASEAPFITFAAERASVSLKDAPYEIKTHSLLQYTLDASGKDWSFVENELDCAYRYTTQEHPFRQKHSYAPGAYIEDGWQNQVELYYENLERNQTHNRSSFQQRKAADVDIIFTTYAHSNLGQHAWVDNNEAALTALEYIKERVKEKDYRVYVELYDVIPANSHPECTQWHMYGKRLTPSDEGAAFVIYHWIFHGTREQADAYCFEQYYTVKPASPTYSMYKTKQQGVEITQSFVTCYGLDPVRVKITEKDNAEATTH